MPEQKFIIWGREFELKVIYDCFQTENPTEIQKNAFLNFIKKPELFDDCRYAVEEYCKKFQADIPLDNLFRYIVPQSIFIQRAEQRIVGILCVYKFDIEHGVAIVFKNEKFEKIGPQDIIL